MEPATSRSLVQRCACSATSQRLSVFAYSSVGMRECVCTDDRFGDNDVEIAAAASWDDGTDTQRPTASYVPLPPTVTVRPNAM